MAVQRRKDGPHGRAVSPDALHISLNNVGMFETHPDAAILLASEAAEMVFMPPFKVALNRLVTWQAAPGQRPLVLTGDEGVIGVDRLYDALARALGDVGLALHAKPAIVAHMTLARGVAPQPMEIVRPPVEWWVREFALVLIPPGDRRRVLRTWVLTG